MADKVVNIKDINDIVKVFNSIQESVAEINEASILNTYTSVISICKSIGGDKKDATFSGGGIIDNLTTALKSIDKFKPINIEKFSAVAQMIDVFGEVAERISILGPISEVVNKQFDNIKPLIVNMGKFFTEIGTLFTPSNEGQKDEEGNQIGTDTNVLNMKSKDIIGKLKEAPKIMMGLIEFALMGQVAIPIFSKFVKQTGTSILDMTSQAGFDPKNFQVAIAGVTSLLNIYNNLIDTLTGKNGSIFVKLLKLAILGPEFLYTMKNIINPIISEMTKPFLIWSQEVEITDGKGKTTKTKYNISEAMKGVTSMEEIIKSYLNAIKGMIKFKVLFKALYNRGNDIQKDIVNLNTSIETIIAAFAKDIKLTYAVAEEKILLMAKIFSTLKKIELSIIFVATFAPLAILGLIVIWKFTKTLAVFIKSIKNISIKEIGKAILIMGSMIVFFTAAAALVAYLALFNVMLDKLGGPMVILYGLISLLGTLVVCVGLMWLFSKLVYSVKKEVFLGLLSVTLMVASLALVAIIILNLPTFKLEDLVNIGILMLVIGLITAAFAGITFLLNFVGGAPMVLLTVISIIGIMALLPIAALLVVATAYIIQAMPSWDKIKDDLVAFSAAGIALFGAFAIMGVEAGIAAPFLMPLLLTTGTALLVTMGLMKLFNDAANFDMSVVPVAKDNITKIMNAYKEAISDMITTFQDNEAFTENKRGGLMGLIGIGNKTAAEAMFESIAASIKPVTMVLELFERVANGNLSYLAADKGKTGRNLNKVLTAATDNIKLILTAYGKMLNEIASNNVLRDVATSGTGIFGFGTSDAEDIFEAIEKSVSPITKVLDLFQRIANDEWSYLKSAELEENSSLFGSDTISGTSGVFGNALNNVNIILTNYGALLNTIASNPVLQEVATSGGFFGFGKSDGEKIFELIGKSVSPITTILDSLNKLKELNISDIGTGMGKVQGLMTVWSKVVKNVFNEDNWEDIEDEMPSKMADTIDKTVTSISKLDINKSDKFIDIMKSIKEMNESFQGNMEEFIDALANKLVPALEEVTNALDGTKPSPFFGSGAATPATATTATTTATPSSNGQDASKIISAIKDLTNEISSFKNRTFTVSPDDTFRRILD